MRDFGWNRSSQAQKRLGIRLCAISWIVFVVSMFLPATTVFAMSGWQCAYFTLVLPCFALCALRVYYFSFVFANLLMLTAPFWLRRAAKRGGSSWRLSALLTLAFVDALTALLLLNGPSSGWRIGYFAWMASFGLMAAGSLMLTEARRRKTAPTFAPQMPIARTPEELAAERELRDFLRLA